MEIWAAVLFVLYFQGVRGWVICMYICVCIFYVFLVLLVSVASRVYSGHISPRRFFNLQLDGFPLVHST